MGALRLSVNRRRMSDAWMNTGSRSRESHESWLICDSVSPRSLDREMERTASDPVERMNDEW